MVRGFHAGTQQDIKTALLETLKSFPTPPTSTATTSYTSSQTGTASSEAAGHRLNVDASPALNEVSPSLSRSLNDSVTDSEAAETEKTGDAESSQPQASNITHDTAVERLLRERRIRLEKQKEAREANEKAERKAKAEARNAATAVQQASAKGEQASWASQQRKRKTEAKLERERILRHIDHDKQERRERNERRKALSQAGAEERNQDCAKETDVSEIRPLSEKHDCSLQVRLLNGDIIRKRFRADQDFVESVRPWIDEARTDGNIPYTVKMILSPFPNRNLNESDEKQSLHDLQLSPSSTLTLLPVQNSVSAYPKNQSLLSRWFHAFYDAIALSLIYIMSSIGNVFRLGQARSSQQQPQLNDEMVPAKAGHHDERSQATSDSKIRIRTLHDQRRDQEKNEFYNGNQVRTISWSEVYH